MNNLEIQKIPEYIGHYTDDISVVIYSNNSIFNCWETNHKIVLISSNDNKKLCELKIEECRSCLGFNVYDNNIVYVCNKYHDNEPVLCINFYTIIKLDNSVDSDDSYKIILTKTLQTALNNSCGNCLGTLSKITNGLYSFLWGDFSNNSFGNLVLFNNIGFINQESYAHSKFDYVKKIDVRDTDELELYNYYIINSNKFFYSRALGSSNAKIYLAIFDRDENLLFGQNDFDIGISHGYDINNEFETSINDFLNLNDTLYLLVSVFINIKINVLNVKPYRFDFICDLINNNIFNFSHVTENIEIKPSLIIKNNEPKIFNKTNTIL